MYQRIEASKGAIARGQADGVAVFAFAEKAGVKATLPPGMGELDRETGGALSDAVGRSEWNMTRGRVTWLYPSKGAKRIAVVGLGERTAFDSEYLRVAAASLIGATEAAGAAKLCIELGGVFHGMLHITEVGRAIGEGIGVGNFKFEAFKGAAGKNGGSAAKGKLQIDIDTVAKKELARGLAVAESVNVSRRLAATPPNVANPVWLSNEAKKIAKAPGLRCKIIDAKQAKKLNMGGLLAVGGAGSSAPSLIVLEYAPRKAKRGTKPIVLIGKAVTFDTGGYSIKTNDGMVTMKYDKCGGCTVLATLHAAAALKLDVPVIGIVPAAENMISETAYRPSDILTMSNGVTVEVTNTDAEGRLILADALVYACKNYDPAAIIDLATLTGGAVIALGSFCAAMFVNDEKLRNRLLDGSRMSGERLWELPLWLEHKQAIKGTHGDIVNAAGREASPIMGAAFLSYFVGPNGDANRWSENSIPWAHLDIAGTSDVSGKERDWSGLYPKGATGFGVRLLVRALEATK